MTCSNRCQYRDPARIANCCLVILEQAFADCWRSALDAVAQEYGFSDEMLAAAGGCTTASRYGSNAWLSGRGLSLFGRRSQPSLTANFSSLECKPFRLPEWTWGL